MATEAPTAPAEAQKAAPGAPIINVKAMSDRFNAAMAEGGIPKTPPPKSAEPAPPQPSAPAALTAPQPPKPGIPEPKAKAPETPKPPEPAKPAEPPKSIPSAEFKKLETARDEFKTKWEAAEAKAKEIEAKLSVAVDPKQIEILEGKLAKAAKQAEEAQAFVDRFYLEHSPSFQKAYGEKINQAIEEAKEAAGEELGSQIETAFKLSGKARDEQVEKLMEEQSSFKQTSVAKALSDLKRLQRERDSELANSKENVKKLREFEEQQGKSRQADFAKAVHKSYVDELANFASALPSFALVEGNEAQNTIAKANRAKAEEFIGADLSNPTDRVRLAIWAAHGIDAHFRDKAKDERIAKLTAQLDEMQAANPGIRTATTTTTPAPKADAKAGDRTVSKWHEAMTKGIPAKE